MRTLTLQLQFETSQGGKANINIPSVREDVTAAEVSACMDAIIARGIFATSTGDILKKLGADMIDRNVNTVL